MSEDRDRSVKASLSSLSTGARIPPRNLEALTLPRLRLCAENKNAHDAASGTSTAASTNRDSTPSSSTTITTQSCGSSTEPTESPTSSTAYPSSSTALDPPSSPVRIPARLRRKCPMYAESEGREGRAYAAGKKNAGVANNEPTYAAEGSPPPSPPPIVGVNPVVVTVSPKQGKIEYAARRKHISPPVPVPHLIKKSRGRRVPEPDEARERTHICAVPGCSKSFARAEHLKRHVISLHTHEKRTFSLRGAT